MTKKVNDEIWLFYNHLSNFAPEKEREFRFETVKDNIKTQNEQDKKLLEGDLTLTELENALKQWIMENPDRRNNVRFLGTFLELHKKIWYIRPFWGV